MGGALGTLLGIAAGLALGGAVVWLVPGLPGVVAGMAAAALGYLGVSLLATPERRLGGQAASLLPNGEAISAKLDEAQVVMRKLDRAAGRTRDAKVRKALGRLSQALGKLVAYVQDNPSAYRPLAHWLNTYADQCDSVLQSWSQLEASGDAQNTREGRDDVLLALEGLATAAEGELGQATDAHVAQLEASQEAIRRLAAMDGYDAASPKVSDPTGANGTSDANDANGTREGSESR